MKHALLVVAAMLGSSTAGAQQPPAAPTAGAVLENVQHYYANATHMTALFRQTVTHAAYGLAQHSDGKLWLAKPNRLRWDYVAKQHRQLATTKSFVFDGTTFWLVDHQNKQIVQSQPTQSVMPAAVAFLTGSASLAKDFNVTIATTGTYGGSNDIVLALAPKQASAAYKRLYFVVDRASWHVRESIVIASNGDTNQFAFYAPHLNSAVAPALFAVTPKSYPTYRLVTPKATAPAPGPAAPAPHAPASRD